MLSKTNIINRMKRKQKEKEDAYWNRSMHDPLYRGDEALTKKFDGKYFKLVFVTRYFNVAKEKAEQLRRGYSEHPCHVRIVTDNNSRYEPGVRYLLYSRRRALKDTEKLSPENYW